jgi:hypothetical protein
MGPAGEKLRGLKTWEGDMIGWIKARIRVLILYIENYMCTWLNLQYCSSVLLIFFL